MPDMRKMPNAKFRCQPLSKNARFEEFGTKNAKLATLRDTAALLTGNFYTFLSVLNVHQWPTELRK